MPKCIFCKSDQGHRTKKEHVIPESLGGDEVLRRAFVCDQCNGYFGAKVEKFALESPLFASIRSFLCIRTKKGRFARHRFGEYLLSGTQMGPVLHVPFESAESLLSEKKKIVLPFDFSFKGSIARMLLKSALELIAETDSFDVFEKSFDAARKAARGPSRMDTWPLAYSIGAVQEEETVFADALENTAYRYELRQHPVEGTLVLQLQFYVTEKLMCFLMVPITTQGDLLGQIVQFNLMNPSVVPLVVESVPLVDSLCSLRGK